MSVKGGKNVGIKIKIENEIYITYEDDEKTDRESHKVLGIRAERMARFARQPRETS